MGLESLEIFHRIIVHPDDPNTGLCWSSGRSLGQNYGSREFIKLPMGGNRLEQILYRTTESGIADLV